MDISGYLEEIRKLYASGQSTEHSFRPLQRQGLITCINILRRHCGWQDDCSKI